MDWAVEALIVLTNNATSLQPTVSTGGVWSTNALPNDTYRTPSITFTQGMDGTNLVLVSQAQDLYGAKVAPTNVLSVLVDATFPNVSSIAASP